MSAGGTGASADLVDPASADRGGLPGVVFVLAALTLAVLAASAWHVTQGTSDVGFADLWRLVVGGAPERTRDVLIGSRLPRVGAAVAVGFALGVAGALLQSLTRNVLAAPDTLAVTAGAYFSVVCVAAFGLSIPLWASTAVAFVGGLAAAGLVLVLAGSAAASSSQLLLAGSAIALALQSGTSALLILFAQETTSLFAWGSGSLSQLNLDAFSRAAPLIVAATFVAILIARRLDLLALGDDTASAMGVSVRRTRTIGVGLAVVLTAGSVTLAGPIGFVGLAAPVVTRMIAGRVPPLLHHGALIPAAGLCGALLVVVADAVVRAVLTAKEAIGVPTGVTTTFVGAIVMILVARRMGDGAAGRATSAAVAVRSRQRFVVVLGFVSVLVVVIAVVGLLTGATMLRTGDIVAWLSDEGLVTVRFALDERAPRVLAALLAGGALALAGTIVQATVRNPLAEPGLLGITGGAGLAVVLVVTHMSGASMAVRVTAAGIGSVVAFCVVYGLSRRGGLDTDRLILVGIGFWYGTTALSTYFLLQADPYNTPRVYTWLSGSTYGRSFVEVVPTAVALAVAAPVVLWFRRELDLLVLDEDTPRIVGLDVERTRLVLLGVAALLASTSVIAVGVVGFVGLVAPHAARALVGFHHARVVPVAVLIGAVLMGVADAVGRTVIAPSELPAGLAVALVGTPYFIFLLMRSRAHA